MLAGHLWAHTHRGTGTGTGTRTFSWLKETRSFVDVWFIAYNKNPDDNIQRHRHRHTVAKTQALADSCQRPQG